MKDTERWKKEVTPIIGKTDLFIFLMVRKIEVQRGYQYLENKAGFKFLAGVGPNNFTDIGEGSVYQDRVAIDGLNLYDFKYKLKPFVDPDKVYSKEDRSYFKGEKGYK